MQYVNVAIVGKPNAGKSTFINHIAKSKISITSHKPQTTRVNIYFTLTLDDCTYQFIDTPGFHNPRLKFDVFMNSQVKDVLRQSDVVLYFFDLTSQLLEDDEKLLSLINQFECKNTFLVLTKYDISSEKKASQVYEIINRKQPFANHINISVFKKINIDLLLKKIQAFAHQDNNLLNEKQDDKQYIAEVIREQIIFNTKQELPYACSVVVEKFDNQNDIIDVGCVIYVEKEGQKGIIIGKNGNMLSKIGKHSRLALEKHFNKKMFINIFVKVKENWRDDEHFLKSIGYSKK